MNVLLWHVHGSWTTAFVQGAHRVVLPVLADRGPFGRGRARTWDWPANAVELLPDALRDEPIDVVVVQRPEEEALATAWLDGRRPGRDVPLIWLEHNAPQGRVNDMRHPAADRHDLTIVHVTHTNALFWDCGSTPTTVIEHGIVDPGPRYRGDIEAAAVVINEAHRRWRVSGTDLLPRFSSGAPIDLFGMGASEAVAAFDAEGRRRLRAWDDVPQDRLHDEIARRRVYLHPFRWTSLGLALVEAMHLGLPVVALATTEVPAAVPASAGVVSNRPDVVVAALRRFLADPAEAAAAGAAARAAALERFGLRRFLADWDDALRIAVAAGPRSPHGVTRRPAVPSRVPGRAPGRSSSPSAGRWPPPRRASSPTIPTPKGDPCTSHWFLNTPARWRCSAASTPAGRTSTSRSWPRRSSRPGSRSPCTPDATTRRCPTR